MRKKSFIKAVSLFVCLSIFMLSVPGVMDARKVENKFSFHRLFSRSMFSSIFPFLNLRTIEERGDRSSYKTSDDDSNPKIKIAGSITSPKRADKDS